MYCWRSSSIGLCLAAGVIGVLAARSAAAQPTMTRVSVGPGGAQASGDSRGGAISADGRWVAFASWASDLVPGDTNGEQDIFLYDASTGMTTRVSVGSGGAQANASSYDHAISADGRFVAFSSIASNLVSNDTNGETDIFVHDRLAGATTLVSVATGGRQGHGSSNAPAISADGRWVAFHSDFGFVAEDTNGVADVFVHDRQTAVTTRVSVGAGGAQANAQSVGAAISADGRFLAFQSFATNLVAGDTNEAADVFVRDRETGTTTRVSVGTGGMQAGGLPGTGSFRPTISADGRLVAFTSGFATLVFDDTNDEADAFVHDRQTGVTTRLSVGTGGTEANGFTFGASISPDGRRVVFHSLATNLAADDTNGVADVFVHDRAAGTTERVSLGPGGVQANGVSAGGIASAAGRYVPIQSEASNLVGGDTNGNSDVFVLDRGTPCGLTLAPASAMVAAEGGSRRVLVLGEMGCGWNAVSSDPDWLIVTGGGSGAGFGTVEFSVAPNSGGSRTGTIAIGGSVFTVQQADQATPLAPIGLIVHSVVGNRVTLHWASPPGATAPTGFVLEGGVRPGEVLASIPTGSTAPAFTFDAPAGSFFVRVHALNGAVRSPASNEIRLHVGVAVPPSAPANLIGVVSGSTVSLVWTNTHAGGAPAAILLQVFDSLHTTIPLGPIDRVSFSGVPPGTYRLAVRAANGSGASEPSSTITLTVPDSCSGPPAVPADLLAYSVGRSAFVSWEPGPAGAAPTAYVLTVTGAAVGAFVTADRELSSVVAPGSYTLSIVAINPCGISPGTAPQTIVVQ